MESCNASMMDLCSRFFDDPRSLVRSKKTWSPDDFPLCGEGWNGAQKWKLYLERSSTRVKSTMLFVQIGSCLFSGSTGTVIKWTLHSPDSSHSFLLLHMSTGLPKESSPSSSEPPSPIRLSDPPSSVKPAVDDCVDKLPSYKNRTTLRNHPYLRPRLPRLQDDPSNIATQSVRNVFALC